MENLNTTKQSALFTLISVFFFWGFVAASNDILIPVFKEKSAALEDFYTVSSEA